MKRVLVKICGLTSPGDARACQAAGADYLGMIFAESPRRISRAGAAQIRVAVPEAKLVGVFMNHPADQIAEIASETALDLIQLHGDESVEVCADLRARTKCPVIKAVRGTGTESILRDYGKTDFLLLDLEKGAEDPAAARTQLWQAAAALGAAGRRVFLAGLLDAGNVGRAIAIAQPFAIDVCRGVEDAPGIKNIEAVHRFLAEVRRCSVLNP